MAVHPRVQFAAISPFLAQKMQYQAGVPIPAARGFGFHVMEQGMTYLPRRLDEVLIWKNSRECEDNQEAFDILLAEANFRMSAKATQQKQLRFHHLRQLRDEGDASYKSIGSFRSVVFVAYEVLLMTFYELYHIAIPLFLPTLELSSFFMYRGPVTFPHCSLTLDTGSSTEDPLASSWPYSPFERERVSDRLAWLQAYTDWYSFPHLQYFASIVGLLEALYTADLQAISAAMRLETEGALAEAAVFWRSAFTKVLASSAATAA